MRIAFSRKLLGITIAVLWVVALGSAAGAIDSKHRARELFVTLERLNGQRDNLEVEWGQLQLEQSVAFVLCDVEERSSVEAAELVGAPEATLRSRLFHARNMRRVSLEQDVFRLTTRTCSSAPPRPCATRTTGSAKAPASRAPVS